MTETSRYDWTKDTDALRAVKGVILIHQNHVRIASHKGWKDGHLYVMQGPDGSRRIMESRHLEADVHHDRYAQWTPVIWIEAGMSECSTAGIAANLINEGFYGDKSAPFLQACIDGR